jgi:hypothetical protein
MLISVIGVIALIALVVMWIWLRPAAMRSAAVDLTGRNAPAGYGRSAADPPPVQGEQDFRSVTIHSTASQPPCQTAIDLADQRFLLADAPALPLPGCASNSCRCGFVRYDDRREYHRRASHDMHEAVCHAAGIANRRSFWGRRSSK